MRYLLILCLALTSSLAAAQAYRWVDANGRTIIADTPPPPKARSIAKVTESNDNPDGQPFAVRKAAEAFPVTLYTSADCTTDCMQARETLNGRGVPFSEKMLQSAADANELKQLVGDVFIPSLKVGKQSFRGFESAAYHNLLDLAGYPKSAAYGAKPSGGLKPVEKTN